MGYQRAYDAGRLLPLEEAVSSHLQSNFYPPHDPKWIGPVVWAIEQVVVGNGKARMESSDWTIEGKRRGAIPCATQIVRDFCCEGIVHALHDKEAQSAN